jgi:hypothetical protein
MKPLQKLIARTAACKFGFFERHNSIDLKEMLRICERYLRPMDGCAAPVS